MPLRSALGDEQARLCLVGVHGSTAACALALLNDSLQRIPDRARPWVVVTSNDDSAERMFNDLSFFHELMGRPVEDLAWFPEWETLPYEATAPHVGLIAHRMTTLHRLLINPPTILVTSVAAAMHRVIPRLTFEQAVFRFETAAAFERDSLITNLLRLGYRRVSVVEIPGEFSIRGGIVDIFSTAYPNPIRVEFLGDQVESIRLFDPSTQTSVEKLHDGWVLPAREFVRSSDDSDAITPIQADAEWRSPDLYDSMDTLFDYLTAVPFLALDQPDALKKACESAWEKIDDGYLRHVDRDAARPYPSPERLFLTWQGIEQRIETWPMLALEPLAAPDSTWHQTFSFSAQAPGSIGLGIRGTAFSQTLNLLEGLRNEHRVVLVARSRGQVDRLLALLREHELPADPWKPTAWSSDGTGNRRFMFCTAIYPQGFSRETFDSRS
jgi:transcription-repair coupling factor (superfamily II helicase)